jgi:hypothetical protein
MIPRRVSFLLSICAAAFLVACGSDSGGGSAGPCEGDSPAAECGATCNSLTPCASGFYCSDNGTCTADCTAGGDQCGDGEVCSVDGQCGSGGGDDDGSDGSSDDGDDDDGGDNCPAVTVNLTAVIPDVMLVLDQSGSMTDDFGGIQRWEAMRNALFGPNGGQNNDGIIFQLQGQLNMGATLYTSRDASPTCPELVDTPLALNNAQAIEDLLAPPAVPIEDTPTGESVDAVVANFQDNGNPRVIVLATDGLPDTCANHDPDTAEEQAAANVVAETSVVNAFKADIRTFALSIGPEVSQDHLQRLANGGQGIPLDTVGPDAAKLFQADSPAELADAFETIVGDIRSCDIDVDGEVDLERADEGTVILEGETLTYGEDADWFMVDEDTFRLNGAACETFKATADVELSAEFPCGVVIDVD